MSELVIRVRRDLSLSNLKRFSRRGYSVIRSAHVGNQRPTNLVLAKAGFDLVLYDRTIGKKDENYRPHRVVIRGKEVTLGADDRLASHLSVTDCDLNGSVGKFFPVGGSVVLGHTQSFRQAFPLAKIITWSDYLRQHQSTVAKVFEATFDDLAGASNLHFHWRRHVSEAGIISDRSLGSSQGREVAKLAYGLNGDKAGWLNPNILNLLLHVVIESHCTEKNRVFALSGTTMHLYVNQMLGTLNQLYETVRKKLPELRLPAKLTFELVPVGRVGWLGVEAEKRDALDSVFSAWQEYEDWKRYSGIVTTEELLAKNYVQPTKLGHLDAVPTIKVGRQGLRRELKGRLGECAELLEESVMPSCLTQHDLLAGKSLYVRPEAVLWSMAKLGAVRSSMKRIYDQ